MLSDELLYVTYIKLGTVMFECFLLEGMYKAANVGVVSVKCVSNSIFYFCRRLTHTLLCC